MSFWSWLLAKMRSVLRAPEQLAPPRQSWWLWGLTGLAAVSTGAAVVIWRRSHRSVGRVPVPFSRNVRSRRTVEHMDASQRQIAPFSSQSSAVPLPLPPRHVPHTEAKLDDSEEADIPFVSELQLQVYQPEPAEEEPPVEDKQICVREECKQFIADPSFVFPHHRLSINVGTVAQSFRNHTRVIMELLLGLFTVLIAYLVLHDERLLIILAPLWIALFRTTHKQIAQADKRQTIDCPSPPTDISAADSVSAVAISPRFVSLSPEYRFLASLSDPVRSPLDSSPASSSPPLELNEAFREEEEEQPGAEPQEEDYEMKYEEEEEIDEEETESEEKKEEEVKESPSLDVDNFFLQPRQFDALQQLDPNFITVEGRSFEIALDWEVVVNTFWRAAAIVTDFSELGPDSFQGWLLPIELDAFVAEVASSPEAVAIIKQMFRTFTPKMVGRWQEDDCFYAERELNLSVPVLSVLTPLFGGASIVFTFLEKVRQNQKLQVIECESMNESITKFLIIVERRTIKPHPTKPHTTILTLSAQFYATSLCGLLLRSTVRNYAVRTFKKESEEGSCLFENYLKLVQQAIANRQ